MSASKTPPTAMRAAGFLLPLMVTLVAAVLTLRLLDALPAYWQSWTTPRSAPPVLAERLEYATIEEAERGLEVRIALPSYFPSYLRWPPATIRGQPEPVKVASLLFLSSQGQQALQIRELFWPGEEIPLPIPEPAGDVRRTEVRLGDAPALLIQGQGQDGTPINQLRWRAGGMHLVATTIYPPEELLRIASSIHGE
ncbi:MAG TPA: hypothetical protein VFD42_08075 [Chloroflexota bacterium]|nr:hypothetical protein [Chloroflexota bacterium]